ncbi:EndoU domain-containing protein, partial [Nocardioides sp.]|uniref:EndoU domain-containing protein n=1 Tax=Nocardioides sp. TaxID=35761 RepID=UPI00286E0425
MIVCDTGPIVALSNHRDEHHFAANNLFRDLHMAGETLLLPPTVLAEGHRPGTGFPKKSEFPSGWSDDRIMHEISDVATDPSLVWRPGDRAGDFFVSGTRSGIDVEVLIRNNQIW